MIVTESISAVRQLRRRDQRLSWGLVPTMGFLHDGHISLVKLAREQNDRVAVSIFVNPTQFAPHEDLDSYPRDMAHDRGLLSAAGADLLFVPKVEIMYPHDFQTVVKLHQVTQPLEGSSRPTHFDGVATVVTKLFNIVQPGKAYFGQKDAQQTVVIKQLVSDLNFDIEIVIGPTIREADGLALSSRNNYLNSKERKAAAIIFYALQETSAAIQSGLRDGDAVRDLLRQTIGAEPLARIDYISAADPQTLLEYKHITGEVLLSTAVFFSKTRLIDNIKVQLPK